MATRSHPRGRASALPLSLITQAVPKLTRHDLEALTERLIERLDELDGDSDAENATDLEDDFALSHLAVGYHDGPGCPISDAGGLCDEDGINSALYSFGYEPGGFGPGCPINGDAEPAMAHAEMFQPADLLGRPSP